MPPAENGWNCVVLLAEGATLASYWRSKRSMQMTCVDAAALSVPCNHWSTSEHLLLPSVSAANLLTTS
jgi:hypothetical protein